MKLLTIILSLLPIFALGQESLIWGDLEINPPVEFKMRLSGSFGELRNNHFHAGIDIKPKKGEGKDSIYNIAIGYVSRVRSTAGGYGNAIYIDHPNGFTSVYGHLKDLHPVLKTIFREHQRKHESLNVDLYLDSLDFPLDQRTALGTLGNSGRSYAPHLHFEIRETESEVPINPFLAGLDVADDINPIINDIRLYGLTPNMQVVTSRSATKTDNYLGAWRCAVGIKGYDKMNGASNFNGIYSMAMTVDDTLYYSIKLDDVSFDDTRFINSMIDYPEYKKSKRRYFMCYQLPANTSRLIDSVKNRGVFNLYSSRSRRVKIIARDYHGNEYTRDFKVYRDKQMIEPIIHEGVVSLAPDQSLLLSSRDSTVHVFFPPRSVYKNEEISLTKYEDDNKLVLGDESIALRKSCKMSYSIGLLDQESDITKYTFVRFDKKPYTYGANIINDRLETSTRDLGEYRIMKDTIPPQIKLLSKSNNQIKFSVKDNFTAKGEADDLEISCNVNGVWYPAEYNLLRNSLLMDTREWDKGKHIVTITVTDDRRNTAVETIEIKI